MASKRISMTVGGMLLALILLPATVRAESFPPGDVNCDTQVTTDDIRALLDVIFSDATDMCGTADVNGDTRESAADVVKLISLLPAPTTPTTPLTATVTATSPPAGTSTATDTPTRTPTVTLTGAPSWTPTVTRPPTATWTPTPNSVGPIITFFGLATAEGVVLTPDSIEGGIPVYNRPSGGGFPLIIVEARPGSSGLPPGTFTGSSAATSVPNLQIEASQNLGNGSPAVCDVGPPPNLPLGGVPGIASPNFDTSSQTVLNALNDFGCRFAAHQASGDACTLTAGGGFDFVASDTTVQYCPAAPLGHEMAFPSGSTLLTVQVSDSGGNISSFPKQLIVRTS